MVARLQRVLLFSLQSLLVATPWSGTSYHSYTTSYHSNKEFCFSVSKAFLSRRSGRKLETNSEGPEVWKKGWVRSYNQHRQWRLVRISSSRHDIWTKFYNFKYPCSDLNCDAKYYVIVMSTQASMTYI